VPAVGKGDIMVVDDIPLPPSLLALQDQHTQSVMLMPLVGINDYCTSSMLVVL
jgi:hypothetical protein